MTTEIDTAATTLALAPEVWKAVCRWAERSYPHEICGYLIGRQNGEHTRVLRAVRAPTMEGRRGAIADGLDIVGYWQTRPDQPARPSGIAAERARRGWSYLVAGVGGDWITFRSWRLQDGVFVEEGVRTSGER